MITTNFRHKVVEENRCYIDIFTCSNTMNGLLGVELIKEMIPHEEFYVQYAER
jgi:S-adenosylmethionine/arginine decarboxylase-like enzyme